MVKDSLLVSEFSILFFLDFHHFYLHFNFLSLLTKTEEKAPQKEVKFKITFLISFINGREREREMQMKSIKNSENFSLFFSWKRSPQHRVFIERGKKGSSRFITFRLSSFILFSLSCLSFHTSYFDNVWQPCNETLNLTTTQAAKH